ncbi:MAG: type 1 glutamine amidotransferase domain-containing protein [Candidatus Bathyarchaeia archaeon]
MSLKGKKVAVLAGPEYEDLELHYPYLRLIEEGAEVKVLAVKKEVVKGKHGLSIEVDLSMDEANPKDFDCVIIPGGWAPDRLRRDPRVLNFVKSIYEQGKIVAAICHGPQVLISAGILKGKRATCVSAIKDDVINAGAKYEDSPVVRDGNIITSRVPSDLPLFCREIIKALSQ